MPFPGGTAPGFAPGAPPPAPASGSISIPSTTAPIPEDSSTRAFYLPPIDGLSRSYFVRLALNDDRAGLVRNQSENLALFVRVTVLNGKDGGDIAPVYWSDNYLPLLPGESRNLGSRSSSLGRTKRWYVTASQAL